MPKMCVCVAMRLLWAQCALEIPQVLGYRARRGLMYMKRKDFSSSLTAPKRTCQTVRGREVSCGGQQGEVSCGGQQDESRVCCYLLAVCYVPMRQEKGLGIPLLRSIILALDELVNHRLDMLDRLGIETFVPQKVPCAKKLVACAVGVDLGLLRVLVRFQRSQAGISSALGGFDDRLFSRCS